MGTPFLLPQKDPLHDMELLKSYNVPEWMTHPIAYDLLEITNAVTKEAKNAVYAGKVVKN